MKRSSQKSTQPPKNWRFALKRASLWRAQGVGLAVGAMFFFLADDSLLLSVLVGVAWAAGVLASDWQRRKIRELELKIERYEWTLRQYAGVDAKIGDLAREVLREER